VSVFVFNAASSAFRLALDGGPPILLFYASLMFKLNLQFVILLPVSLFFVLLANSDFQVKERPAVESEPEADIPAPCAELQVISVGAVCRSRFGIVARLDFPEVDLRSVLAGGEYLPQAKAVFTTEERTVGDKAYRNIALHLRWEPATPEFLQIYLNDYIPYWGNQVPYRLFWNTSYEVCSVESCNEWALVSGIGEFLPSDVGALQSDLAADINFNGVPVAFWNTRVSP